MKKRLFYIPVLALCFGFCYLLFKNIIYMSSLTHLQGRVESEITQNARRWARDDYNRGEIRYLAPMDAKTNEIFSKESHKADNNIPVFYYYYDDSHTEWCITKNRDLANYFVDAYNERMKALVARNSNPNQARAIDKTKE